MTDTHPCEAYLRLRTRYVLSWLRMIGSGLVAVLGLLIPSEPVRGMVLILCGAVFVASFAQNMIIWFRILRWPCPRCGKSFVWAWWSTWPTNQCKHCGLSVEGGGP